MPRRHRHFDPGAIVHLTARGVDGTRIFLCDLDRHGFLAVLRRVTERVRWQVVAWCLMDTHYHLLVAAAPEPAPRIAWAMQTLNGSYAREFNARHARRGHLFGERYADTVVATDDHLAAAHEYVLRNPVSAGLVAATEAWRWSGGRRLEPRPRQRSRNVRSSPPTTSRPATSSSVPATPPTATPTPSSAAAAT